MKRRKEGKRREERNKKITQTLLGIKKGTGQDKMREQDRNTNARTEMQRESK